MAKDAMRPEDIYNEMRKMFPGEYRELKKIKPRLPSRGEKPKRPVRHIFDSQEFTPDMTLQEIGTILRGIPSSEFRISIELVPDGIEEYEDEDWTYNSTTGEEEYRARTASRTKYGDTIAKIKLSTSYERPDWRCIETAWQESVQEWERAGIRKVERDRHIHEARQSNKNLMEITRKSNHNRWVMTARKLKGINCPKYLIKQRERLRNELENLDEMIGDINEEQQLRSYSEYSEG